MMLFLTLLRQPAALAASWFGQALFFEHYQKMRCLWCWPHRHPNQPYPYESSHMCRACKDAQLAQFAARRAARAMSSKEVLA